MIKSKWKPKLISYVLLLFGTIMLSFFGLLIDKGYASENQSRWELERVEALNYADRNRCDKAWPILWKWARIGNKEALRWSAATMFSVGMTVPGGSTDRTAIRRYSVIFATHALSNENRNRDNKFLVNYLNSMLFPGKSAGHPFKSCLAGKNLDKCAAIAASTSLLPDFDTFIKEIDALITRTNEKSYCSMKPLH